TGVQTCALPIYSDVGYNTSQNVTLDTLQYRKSTTGEGGLNKAFVGYGVNPIKGLSLGANVGLLFGNLADFSSIEFPYTLGAYNTRLEDSRLIRVVIVDYGAQYSMCLGNRT